MWKNFSGKTFDRAQFAIYAASLHWTDWKPIGIVLHNTGAPTLKQWVESGSAHDQRIASLEHYYEGMGWHAGPAAFISRSHVTEFSGFVEPGVHSTCFNHAHIGIEMAGDFTAEPFATGDGAMVRDTAIAALAALYKALKFDPHGLLFHKDCVRDHHDCPGHNVSKPDIIARIVAAMAAH